MRLHGRILAAKSRKENDESRWGAVRESAADVKIFLLDSFPSGARMNARAT
jgi:hypothetical protein